MVIFDNVNKEGKCLICGRNDSGKVILVPVSGTSVGITQEAKYMHVKCVEMIYYPEAKVIAHKL